MTRRRISISALAIVTLAGLGVFGITKVTSDNGRTGSIVSPSAVRLHENASITFVRFQSIRLKYSTEELLTVDPDGNAVRGFGIEGQFGLYGRPVWSQDGRRMAFAGSPGPYAPGGIYVVVESGGPPSKIGPCGDSNCVFALAWSPDGSTFAYVAKTRTIHTVRADGTGDRAIFGCIKPTCPFLEGGMGWSPDGSTIAFSGYDDDYFRAIYLIHPDGTGFRKLTNCPSQDCGDTDPAWSPDGSRIVFGREAGLALVDPKNGAISDLIRCPQTGHGPPPCAATEPAWSPDGSLIAFANEAGGISVVRSDGTDLRVLTRAPGPTFHDRFPSWRPGAVRVGANALALPAPAKEQSPQWSSQPPPDNEKVSVGDGDWAQFQGGPGHTGFNPDEKRITPSTVARLRKLWVSDLPPIEGNWGSPVVAGRFVYVGGGDGRLYVFSAGGCGAARCPPIWAGVTKAHIQSGAAISDGLAFVGADDRLYVFAAGGCGRRLCDPLWQGATGGKIKWSSPTVANGIVYVGTTGPDSSLYAFQASGCRASICQPVWIGRGHPTGSGLDMAPAVADGFVYAQEFNLVHVFQAAGCGRALCPAVREERLLWDTTETYGPAVTGGSLFAPLSECSEGYCGLDVFRTSGCGSDECRPDWVGETGGGMEASPAVGDGTLFAFGAGLGGLGAGLYAFDANGCGSRSCPPLWVGHIEGEYFSSPLVAGGLVFVVASGEYDGPGKVFAFDAAGCGAKACEPLWTARGVGKTRSSLARANGTLFVSGDDGLLVAFGIGPA